jgi:hypothetical protein
MSGHVRPWCDLVVARSAKSERARVAKALQIGRFWRSSLTPSLPAIQQTTLNADLQGF